MAQNIAFEIRALRQMNRNILNASNEITLNASKRVGAAQNNRGWSAPERNRIVAQLDDVRKDMSTLSQRVAAFSSACGRTADAFEDAENAFTQGKRAVDKEHRNQNAVNFFNNIVANIRGVMDGIWEFLTGLPGRIGAFIGENPFLRGVLMDALKRIPGFGTIYDLYRVTRGEISWRRMAVNLVVGAAITVALTALLTVGIKAAAATAGAAIVAAPVFAGYVIKEIGTFITDVIVRWQTGGAQSSKSSIIDPITDWVYERIVGRAATATNMGNVAPQWA